MKNTFCIAIRKQSRRRLDDGARVLLVSVALYLLPMVARAQLIEEVSVNPTEQAEAEATAEAVETAQPKTAGPAPRSQPPRLAVGDQGVMPHATPWAIQCPSHMTDPCKVSQEHCIRNNVMATTLLSAVEQATGSSGPRGCAAALAFEMGLLAAFEVIFQNSDEPSARECADRLLKMVGTDVASFEQSVERAITIFQKTPEGQMARVCWDSSVFFGKFIYELAQQVPPWLRLGGVPVDAIVRAHTPEGFAETMGFIWLTAPYLEERNVLAKLAGIGITPLAKSIIEYLKKSADTQAYFEKSKGCMRYLDDLAGLGCAAVSCGSGHAAIWAAKAACIVGTSIRGTVDCKVAALACMAQRQLGEAISRPDGGSCPFTDFSSAFQKDALCGDGKGIRCNALNDFCKNIVDKSLRPKERTLLEEISGTTKHSLFSSYLPQETQLKRDCVRACVTSASENAFKWCPEVFNITIPLRDGTYRTVSPADFASYQEWVNFVERLEANMLQSMEGPSNRSSKLPPKLLCQE